MRQTRPKASLNSAIPGAGRHKETKGRRLFQEGCWLRRKLGLSLQLLLWEREVPRSQAAPFQNLSERLLCPSLLLVLRARCRLCSQGHQDVAAFCAVLSLAACRLWQQTPNQIKGKEGQAGEEPEDQAWSLRELRFEPDRTSAVRMMWAPLSPRQQPFPRRTLSTKTTRGSESSHF